MEDLMKRYDYEDLVNNVETDKLDVEQEQDSDDVDAVRNEENRKLYVDKVDKSTSDLFRMIVEGELNLQPDYQRKFVWDSKTMSKFIESLLLSIPIPTIFLAENNDDSFEVIDGQQRLTTIFAFMRSKLSDTDANSLPENLKNLPNHILSGLETLNQYNKLGYADMGEMQRKFNNVSLPVVIIKKDSTEDIKYDIFARINSGSIKLNNQELLNVMYRGVLLQKLNEVASTDSINDLFGNRPMLKKRFGYHEILLRAKAMEAFINKETWSLQEVPVKNTDLLNKVMKKYNGRLNNVILDYLKEYRDDVNEADELQKFISDVTEKVEVVFGESAFRRVEADKATSINKTIAELQMVVLYKFDRNEILQNKDKIKESFKHFIETNDENIFIRGTNNTNNVEKRYKWGQIVSDIVKGA